MTDANITRSKSESFKKDLFTLCSQFTPAGDQPQAIKLLVEGVNDGLMYQTLLGVTGSGKTFTIANIIATLKRPALIMAHNKTLAAQLYAEFRDFFPHSAVEYFVSYYDYYQPEAYVPHKDLFIEKDASINDHIEQMRLSATKALLERQDVIVIATVSAIYGIGDVSAYQKMLLHLKEGDILTLAKIISRLITMQYSRTESDFGRGNFRVRGDNIDVFPAEHYEHALRISLFDDKIEALYLFDSLTGKTISRLKRFTIFPSSHYVTPKEVVDDACIAIKQELASRELFFKNAGQFTEALRIKQRTEFDLEMLHETGFCKGIENYSRHLTKRQANEAPPTLIDYLPANSLLFIDESHVTIPQIGGMYEGDKVRKQNLVNYGFRLPSALDNRPLKFAEFTTKIPQTIFVSATPGNYELTTQNNIVEQVVRPTGLVDPVIEIRSAITQVDDLLAEIKLRLAKNERTLITTLTKKMAEKLAEYYNECGIKIRYLHADIDTVERVEIIRDLRLGVFDVLVGVNLLREGLDLPEVSLVAILDADKEGFLRSSRSLIQTIGRAARNINSLAIFYAESITKSMQHAIDETNRRRDKQLAFNSKHNIIPQTIIKPVNEIIDGIYRTKEDAQPLLGSDINNLDTDMQTNYHTLSQKELSRLIKQFERKMQQEVKNLAFEQAAIYRDKIKILRDLLFKT